MKNNGFELCRGKKFDIQLDQSVLWEHVLGELLAGGRIELKVETVQWRKTGNIYLEFRNRGETSGIAATEADVWVHQLNDDAGRPLVSIMFPIERVRDLARWAYAQGWRRRNGGDDRASDGVIVPLHVLAKWLRQGGPRR
jgi:hypothetical protein